MQSATTDYNWNGSDWATWYLSGNDSTQAWHAIAGNFATQLSHIQDSISYYTIEDYVDWIQTYFGYSTYDSVLAIIPQGEYFHEEFHLDELYLYGAARLGSYQAEIPLRTMRFNGIYNQLEGIYTHMEFLQDSGCRVHGY